MNASAVTEVSSAWKPKVASQSQYLTVRGLRQHVRHWHTGGESARALVMLHGWMDSSASFQFVIDELGPGWRVFAPDFRGFGLTERPAADCYWFPDYLADLDQIVDSLVPGESALNVLGHSMGGNVAMLYAGVRSRRVRRLINLEGVGMRATRPREAPSRYAKWLDQLKEGRTMRTYARREDLTRRLLNDHPALGPERAGFIAEHWSRQREDGSFEVLGDPAHKLPNPVLYRLSEALACWRAIEADVLWVMAERPSPNIEFAYKPAFERRLAAIRSLKRMTLADCGHMMHFEKPAAVAALIREFCE